MCRRAEEKRKRKAVCTDKTETAVVQSKELAKCVCAFACRQLDNYVDQRLRLTTITTTALLLLLFVMPVYWLSLATNKKIVMKVRRRQRRQLGFPVATASGPEPQTLSTVTSAFFDHTIMITQCAETVSIPKQLTQLNCIFLFFRLVFFFLLLLFFLLFQFLCFASP